MTRVEGSENRMSIREFENILAGLLDSSEAFGKQFMSAEQEVKKKQTAQRGLCSRCKRPRG